MLVLKAKVHVFFLHLLLLHIFTGTILESGLQMFKLATKSLFFPLRSILIVNELWNQIVFCAQLVKRLPNFLETLLDELFAYARPSVSWAKVIVIMCAAALTSRATRGVLLMLIPCQILLSLWSHDCGLIALSLSLVTSVCVATSLISWLVIVQCIAEVSLSVLSLVLDHQWRHVLETLRLLFYDLCDRLVLDLMKRHSLMIQVLSSL